MAFDSFRQLMREFQGKINPFEGSQNSQHIAFLRQMQKELRTENILNIPLDKLNIVVFDIETTGFYPELGDEIISIGAVKISQGKICDDHVFYSLVLFEQDLPIEISNLTGITMEELRNARPLSDVLIRFFDFVKNDLLVAHHANHEKSFLQNACWKLFRTPFKHRVVDTSFLYRIVEPHLSRVPLEEICQQNGIDVVGRHNALGDAKLAAKLWCHYQTRAKDIGCQNLNDVYELLAQL